ncbi:MAG: hypothetical protein Q9222_006491 [Ikaeria aurantiellina]
MALPTTSGQEFSQTSKPVAAAAISYTSQAPWTAARCQRLLRPLSSKISLLRKEKERIATTRDLFQNQSPLVAPIPLCFELAEGRTGHHRPSSTINVADEEWAPNPRPRKKIKRTYSAKSLDSHRRRDESRPSRHEQDRHASREITIPTTLFQAQPQLADEPLPAEKLLQDTVTQQQDVVTEIQLSIRDNEASAQCLMGISSRNRYRVKLPFIWKLTDGICKGLEALLRVTGKPKADRGYGARSLFSTCVRKIPLRIAQEEEFVNEIEESGIEIDVASMMYSDLESLSTSENYGWESLRHVVRAHGISMVGSAVCEGLIGHHVARNIIAMCGRLEAYDEAQEILGCLIESMEPSPSMKNSDTVRSILSILHDFVTMTGRHSVRYEVLARLLHSGSLTLDSITRHDMIDTWNRAIRSIMQCDEHATSASELLRSATGMTCGLTGHLPAPLIHGLRLRRRKFSKKGREYIASLGYQAHWPRSRNTIANDDEQNPRNEKARSTVSNLLTVLCTVGLLRSAISTSSLRDLPLSDLTILQDVAVDAQQMLALASDRMSLIQSDRMTVPLLAAGLVQATLCHGLQQFDETIPVYFARLSGASNIESVIEEGASFLCAVADCCAQATSDDVFDHIQKVVQHIQCIATALKSAPVSQQLCNRMGLTAAFEYADITKHPKHLRWALDVEQKVTGASCDSAQRGPTRTPMRNQRQTKNGYRWEAGICEWVAKTPANALNQASRQDHQGILKGMSGDKSSQTHAGLETGSLVPSPCSSNGPGSNAFPISPVQNGAQSVEARPIRTVMDNGRPKKLYFSHVYIDVGGDELSVSKSPSETTMSAPCQLQDVTNSAARWRKGHSIHNPRRVACENDKAACTEVLLRESGEEDNVGINVHDILLDSEDELSYL